MLLERGHKLRTWLGAGNDDRGPGIKMAAHGDEKRKILELQLPTSSLDMGKADLSLWIL